MFIENNSLQQQHLRVKKTIFLIYHLTNDLLDNTTSLHVMNKYVELS